MARTASTCWRRAAVLAGAVLLLAAPALRAQSNRGDGRESPEVKKLVLRGVHGVSKDELRESIATQASECRSPLLKVFFCWYTHAPTFFDRHYLDRDELRKDVVRIRVFYFKRGWRDTDVDTLVTPDGDGVRVTFDVREGIPTRIERIAVQYDSTMFKDRVIQRLTRVRAGEPLDLLAIDSTRALLQAELWNKGFGDAVVDTAVVIDTARRAASLTFRLVPNWATVVGPITVRGNEKVATRTIANSLTLRTGESFRRDDVLLSQRNLYESNLFRQATVAATPVRTPVKPIEIIVSEAPQREARWATGFNTVEFVQVEGRLTHHNLLGGARRLDISGVVGNLLAPTLNGRNPFRDVVKGLRERDEYLKPNWQLSADFKQPAWLQRPENALGFGAFAHRRSFPGIYVERGYGTTATLTRMLRVRAPLSANYRFEITRVAASDVFFCVNFGVCDQETLAALRENQRLSPFTGSLLVERADDPFSPTRGYNARADVEHASGVTMSSFRYNRFYADAALYKRLGDRRSTGPSAKVLAGHLRLGLVRALGSQLLGQDTTRALRVLHPRKRFYAGGAQSVRGFGESQLGPRILTVPPEVLARIQGCSVTDSLSVIGCDPDGTPREGESVDDGDFTPRPLGGTALIEASVEYRFPLFKKLSGAVFLDGGLVASDPKFRTQPGLQDLARGTGAITPGFGVRYRSPVGPIRMDLGINPTTSEELPVVTEVIENGVRRIVRLDQARTYSPSGGARGLGKVLSRLTLHLSIGQAY